MKKTIWPGALTSYLILVISISLLPAIPCPAQPRPVNYKLEVELLPPAASLLAKETLVWTNLSQDYIPDMYFHLYWNAFKNELSTLAREARQEKYFKRYRTKEEAWGWIKITSLTTADGHDLLASLPVQCRERLIEKQNLWVQNERAGNSNSLLLAA